MKQCEIVICVYYQEGCKATEWEGLEEKQLKKGEECPYFKKDIIGTYGDRHRKYIEENEEVFFENKLIEGTLEEYLISINKKALNEINKLWEAEVTKARKDGTLPKNDADRVNFVTEARNACEQIVLSEIVYKIDPNEYEALR